MDMQLTKSERLILINQYRILSLLEKNNQDHIKNIEVLERGYVKHYLELNEWLSEDPLDPSHADLVWDTLDMYQAMQRTCSSGQIPADLIFDGFDGNNESAVMCYALFITEKRELYKHVQKRSGLNCHHPSIAGYKQMVAAWKSSPDKFNLTTEDVSRILRARVRS